jgi:ATP-dependent exoDNAse (exonuclease V) beta subunit
MPTKIINASAGSGKTYQLAVAYLQALLQPLPEGGLPAPAGILATTFTRAAASEILERILRRLALAVLAPEELARLLSDIGRPDLGRADLVRLLESVCDALPQLQIGTIDGLFARVVRVLALDLAFPPAWSMADDAMAREMALQAADRMLTGPDVARARDQWLRYAQFKPRLRVRDALVDLLEDNRFNLIDGDIAEDDPALEEPALLGAPEAEELLLALADFEIPLTKSAKPHASWSKAIEAIRRLLQGERTFISILKGHTLLRLATVEGATYYNLAVPPQLGEILGPVVERARNDMRRLHDARLPALAALGRRYHELRRIVAHARGAYLFPEIEAAARLPPPHLTPDDLYFRLDGRIEHLLLDEFQDTSLGQFRFLWPIIADLRAKDRLFFAVGDIKQSIYGWRGADRQLLNRLPEWLDPDGNDPHLTREYLADNRRSSPAILRALDRIFENLDGAACLDPGQYDEKNKARAKIRQGAAKNFITDYRAHVAVGDNRFLAGRVRLLLHAPPDPANDAEDDEPLDEIETILHAVEEHRREDPNREIAILCRRHKLMPAILTGLRRRRINASGEGGNPVTDSAAVEAVLSMLTWLDHPGHTLAREHAQRSGVAVALGIGEAGADHALARETCIAIMRRGLAAVISDWVRHAQFRERGTLHDQVRVEQLVELARLWDAGGGGRLAHFVESVRARRVDNPASSRVRVMTIHGAKGLEFEAVILADIEAFGGAGDGPRLAVTMTTPDAPPTVTLVPAAEDAELLGLEAEYERHQQAKFEEDLSVLYVALSRAKSFLDVVLPADAKIKPTLSTIIRERWSEQEPGSFTIETCDATAPDRTAPAPFEMPRDPGIWAPGDSLAIANFQPVPARLDAVTPSGREGSGLVKLGALLTSGHPEALERGTAVHALLSRLEWLGPPLSERAWLDSIPREEANPETCRQAARELLARLAHPADPLAQVFNQAAWREKWRGDGVTRLEVWRERRFAAVLDGELMNGAFDRVILGLDAEGKIRRAEIFDFKTDRVADEIAREERRRHYQPQLDAYVAALAKLTGLNVAAITAGLVWIN